MDRHASPPPNTTIAPQVSVLGPITITGTEQNRPVSVQMSTEVITFLALHPWDTHDLFDPALWPHTRVTSAQRCSVMNRARNWLGTDPAGRPYVPLVHAQGYRLHPDVELDWDQFTQHTGPTPAAASTTALTRALRLVRGQPLTGINPLRYTWADLDRQNIITHVADAAAALASRSVKGRQSRLANWSSAIGVMVEPSSEVLWKLRLRAARLSADPEQFRLVAAHAHRTLAPLGPLEGATRRLLQQANTTTDTTNDQE